MVFPFACEEWIKLLQKILQPHPKLWKGKTVQNQLQSHVWRLFVSGQVKLLWNWKVPKHVHALWPTGRQGKLAYSTLTCQCRLQSAPASNTKHIGVSQGVWSGSKLVNKGRESKLRKHAVYQHDPLQQGNANKPWLEGANSATYVLHAFAFGHHQEVETGAAPTLSRHWDSARAKKFGWQRPSYRLSACVAVERNTVSHAKRIANSNVRNSQTQQSNHHHVYQNGDRFKR